MNLRRLTPLDALAFQALRLAALPELRQVPLQGR